MTTSSQAYVPISCDFHDVLEATATRRSTARIVFRDPDGTVREHDTRIVDLATRAEGEFMTLETGECIRFDRIVSIDGIRLVDHPA